MGENCTNRLTIAFKFNDMLLGHCVVDTSLNAAATISTNLCVIGEPVSQIYLMAFFEEAVNPRCQEHWI